MNIFILDNDPVLSAQYHNNRHCIKMILEQTQLLCSVHWMNGQSAPYKLTHKNHPCAIWARTSVQNYNWLLRFTRILGGEYTFRYGKIHKSYLVARQLPPVALPDIGLTPFVQCMPDQYKCSDTVQAYRNYYIGEKMLFSEWKNRPTPEWVILRKYLY